MTRILLVEDDLTLLQRTKATLQTDYFPDYTFYTAGSLREAIDKIKDVQAVSLIVADYELTDGNAYDLLKYCQENLSDVPVIIITAFGHDASKEVRAALSFQKGAFDFIDKSSDIEELVERIKRALEIVKALA